jgi:hypothetical protein
MFIHICKKRGSERERERERGRERPRESGFQGCLGADDLALEITDFRAVLAVQPKHLFSLQS